MQLCAFSIPEARPEIKGEAMAGNLYTNIAEKRKIMRELYGGMMTLTDVARELSVNRDVALAWVHSLGLGVQVGKRVRYETDEVAKAIVRARGMCVQPTKKGASGMSAYRICEECGAALDPGERCDCRDTSRGDELLALYGLAAGTGKCTCPNGQMQPPKGADELAQTGKCIYGIPCINHDCTDMTPCSPPRGGRAAV